MIFDPGLPAHDPRADVVSVRVGTIMAMTDGVHLLGSLRIIRNGVGLPLPRSRKVRALLAYLLMTPRPVARDKLCELFWDIADDPKSELRWCLSKLRPLLDTPEMIRLVADREQVRIDTSSLDVDAFAVARSAPSTLAGSSPDTLQSLRALFRGEFLEGFSLDRAPEFDNWLAGQRHHFARLRQRLLERLGAVLPPESDDRLEVLRERIDVGPFDEAAHIELIKTLRHRALYAEAEHQIEASVSRFQNEGIDPISLRSAIATARSSDSRLAGSASRMVSRLNAEISARERNPKLPAPIIDLTRRQLLILGSPAPMSTRAFEMLEVLVRSAGRLVTKDELMSRAWPGAMVTASILEVHVRAVRRALGPYRGLLKTEPRRGYRLLGEWPAWRHATAPPPSGLGQVLGSDELARANFPAAIAPLIGRSDALRMLRTLVSAYRVVTLTGAGGIGKTALALELARRVFGDFANRVRLVELASLSDPDLVPSVVAGALALRPGSKILSPEAVARAIAEQELLLVLDNCEHVVDAAATLAETIISMCPGVTILATSREVLRIAGEYNYRVASLEFPSREHSEAREILDYSAPALFVKKAEELGVDFSRQPVSLPTIAAICRHLDGIPLAIEFAASRAAAFGIDDVATSLRDRFALLRSGRRTSLPRHRTLRATLDWSYDLLADPEQVLLRRLAVFAGSFSLEAVSSVTHGRGISAEVVGDLVVILVMKSLVTADFTRGGGYFRLLETTRAYALAKLTENDELQEFSRRHAEYYRGLLEGAHDGGKRGSKSQIHVDDLRVALEWCFGLNGNTGIGIRLAAAAAPMFLAMSLRPECYRWSKRAIDALDDTTGGGAEEMRLQASFGASSMHMHGQSAEARVALNRSLAIAEARGNVPFQAELCSTLTMFHTRAGALKSALQYAKRGLALAGTVGDQTAIALAQSVLGRSLHLLGDHGGARAALETSLDRGLPGTSDVDLGFDHHILANMFLARTLWVQGYPDQAIKRVRQTIRDAERGDSPVFSLGFALFWAPGIFLWVGDQRNAEENFRRLISNGETHARSYECAAGLGYKGSLALVRGDARAAVDNLQACLEQLHAVHYEMLNTEFELSLVQGLSAIGRPGEAMVLVDKAILSMEAYGNLLHMPEALRIRGNLLLSGPRPQVHAVEECFMHSLEWSRRQGARSWELRAALDIARFWVAQEKQENARDLLRPIVETFSEGFDTADLQAAARLLARLQ